MEFSVVFSGQIALGRNADEVRANVARLFRITDEMKLGRLFSGNPVVVKAGLDVQQAKKYQQALRQAGSDCELRPAAVVSAPAARPQPASASSAVADPFAEFASDGAATVSAATTTIPGAASAPIPVSAKTGFSLESLTLAPIEKPEPDPVPEAQKASAITSAAHATAATVATPLRSAAPRKEALVESNSSGSGPMAYMPDEVGGLCWGGFFLSFFWALRHSAFRPAVLCFVPFINMTVPFYLLFKGREIAWRNVRWDTTETFNKQQRWWSIIGLVLVIFLLYGSMRLQNEARRQIQAAAMSPAQRQAEQQKALENIKDTEQREAMRRIFDQLNARSGNNSGSH